MLSYRMSSFFLPWYVVTLGVGGVALAQSPPSQPVIYPANGQNDEQLAVDRAECYPWATTQTGYDPLQALQQQPALLALQAQQAAAAPPPRSGQVVGGAVGGAAGGALIGAAAGNAGKGQRSVLPSELLPVLLGGSVRPRHEHKRSRTLYSSKISSWQRLASN
jgi:hypothetical protein